MYQVILCFAAWLCLFGTVDAAEPTGLQIMTSVDQREDGDTLQQHMKQILIDRNGRERVRQMMSFRKDVGVDKKMISFFLEPANIRDTALLTFDYDNEKTDDDQWLYLPALKKVRRISASDRGDYFMGTDFSFEDMKQTPELTDYSWKLLGSDVLNGHDCWKVQGEPASQSLGQELGYSKIIQYVRKTSAVVVRVDYWDLAQRPLKTMRMLELKEIQGIWTPLKIEMVNAQSSHETVIELSDHVYNGDIADKKFSQRSLKRGYRGH
ncbi:MAG: outer membrane lipoprotein-sorting protein [Mariprofundaceae bacterium]|nr:outer membrane lipoprotein-sorting protein [Mariprofundaceae bacterium]